MSHPVLSLKDVTIYQENKVILSQINLEINHGEFLYIIGKTGSGKSSFMKTLYGDLPLTEGEGQIVEYDLATLQEKDIPFLRRKIGIVFQDFKLLPNKTVFENVPCWFYRHECAIYRVQRGSTILVAVSSGSNGRNGCDY